MPKEPEIFKIEASLDELAKTTMKNNLTPTIDHKDYLTAKYSGKLPIGDKEIRCAVLSNNSRIISSDSVFKLFERTRKGEYRVLLEDGTRLPPFLGAKWMLAYITPDFIERTKKIEYLDNGEVKFGYISSILPDICNMYIQHYQVFTELTPSKQKILNEARILLMAFAKTGLDALIDEATGHQRHRSHDALIILVQGYIQAELRKWLERFPKEFWDQLDRLYGNEKTHSKTRPKYYAGFINTYVYEPLENGHVKAELDKLNIRPDNTRKGRFHQFLSDYGVNILTQQIWRLIGKMEDAKDIHSFKRKNKEQKIISLAPYLFDEFNDVNNI